MEFTFDENIVSDLHKDAYGFRPSQSWWCMWAAFNGEQKQAEWDQLLRALDDSIEEEKLEAEFRVQEFKSWVADTMSRGAGSEMTALRWICQTEEFYHSQDVEFFVWNQGILFTEYGRDILEKLLSIVTYHEMEAA